MRSFKLFFLAAFVAGTAFLGCRVQSEGERCETQNGNQDCAEGLDCVANVQICCPPPGGETTDDCRNARKGGTQTTDAATDVGGDVSTDTATDATDAGDSGTDTATTDAPTDTADAASDTGADAATDTPAG